MDHTIQSQLETPHSSLGTFQLPGGYFDVELGQVLKEIRLQEMDGDAEDILTSENIEANDKISQFCAHCTTQIGPHTDPVKIEQIINDLGESDRIFIYVKIRVVTLGSTYPIRPECKADECKADPIKKLSVDLNDLMVTPVQNPETMVYTIKTPNYESVRLHVYTGKDGKRARKAVPVGAKPLTVAVFMRIDAVDGKGVDYTFCRKMKSSDREAIRSAYLTKEGGIEDEVEVTCPDCGREFKTELNFAGDVGFLFPSLTQSH